jgi:hypothetical protein
MRCDFKRWEAPVLVIVTAFWQLVGCGGRAAVPSDSASLSGGAGASNAGTGGSTGALTIGGLDAGATAASNVGGESQTALFQNPNRGVPDIDGGCALGACCNGPEALEGQPCTAAGETCGPGGCALNCFCVAGDAGKLTWECLPNPCK